MLYYVLVWSAVGIYKWVLTVMPSWDGKICLADPPTDPPPVSAVVLMPRYLYACLSALTTYISYTDKMRVPAKAARAPCVGQEEGYAVHPCICTNVVKSHNTLCGPLHNHVLWVLSYSQPRNSLCGAITTAWLVKFRYGTCEYGSMLVT